MRSIYKCPDCGYEEEVFDEDLEFMHPSCPKCLVLLDYDREA